MTYRLFMIMLAVVGLAIMGCKDDDDAKPACDLPALPTKTACDGPSSTGGMSALELMDAYVTEEGLSVTKRDDNLYYVIIEPGSAEKPSVTDNVTVDYVGYFRNDCAFDANNNITFNLQSLIEGWKTGIPLVGRCGTIKLIVPPSLGYGNTPPAGIPAGEPLIFDINLHDF